jgi:hypothetical protein
MNFEFLSLRIESLAARQRPLGETVDDNQDAAGSKQSPGEPLDRYPMVLVQR